MFQTELTIGNASGLHARPASDLTRFCKKYKSAVLIRCGTVEANPKSVISLLSAGIGKGSTVTLEVAGEDEEQAGREIAAFIKALRD